MWQQNEKYLPLAWVVIGSDSRLEPAVEAYSKKIASTSLYKLDIQLEMNLDSWDADGISEFPNNNEQ